MAWSPGADIDSLLPLLRARRQETLTTQLRDRRPAIANELAARGLARSGAFLSRITELYTTSFREYTDGLVEDVLSLITQPDGSIPREAGEWVQNELGPWFHVVAGQLQADLTNDYNTLGLPPRLEEIDGVIVAAKRDVDIALARAALQPTRSSESLETDAALMDVLLPLRNRRAYEQDLRRLFDESQRADEPLALLLVDVDDFKKVNDELGGHAAGDDALKAVAGLARSCARGKGMAYRYGGDDSLLC